MEKTENPYKGLTRLVQDIGGNAGIQAMPCIGEIVTPPPNIEVRVNGYVLNKKFLWIDEYWVQGHERHNKGHIISETQPRSGGGGYAEFASHTHAIHNDYTENTIKTDTWHTGDKVLLMPIVGDDKKTVMQYVVLCKLVRLDGN